MARAAGDAIIEVTARLSAAILAVEHGEVAAMDAALDRLAEIIDEVADGRLAAYHAMTWAMRHALGGDVDATREACMRAERITRATELTYGSLPVDVLRGVIAVARGEPERARERLGVATTPDDEGKSPVDRSLSVRVLHRLVSSAIERESQTWELGSTWFRAPRGERQDLARRKKLCRLLAAFARARVETPGRVLGYDALREAGWPGEKMLEQAALRRIYVAVGELRKLGLELIETAEDGYRLDPSVPVRVDLNGI